MPDGFGFMDTVFPVFFILMFCLVFGLIIYALMKGVQEKKANDAAPVLTVDALVKTKRVAVHNSAHNQSAEGVPLMARPSHASYYVTFEVESGDRMELRVGQNQFGQLAEGDRGRLTFQRTRFHKFERQREKTKK